MTKITDILGQEIQVGDRIAAAFRYAPYNGSNPELRTGIIVKIYTRKPTHRSYGREEVPFIEVEWDASSEVEHVRSMGETTLKRKEEQAGHPLPRPVYLDREYKKTSSMMVQHKRVIRLG